MVPKHAEQDMRIYEIVTEVKQRLDAKCWKGKRKALALRKWNC